MNKKIKSLALVATLLALLSARSNANTLRSYEINVQGITYCIDPRIELFNAVAVLFGHNGMTQANIPYKQQLLDYFMPYQHHPVVDSLLHSYYYGWGVDDPIFFMLCLDKDFKIMPGLDPYQIKRGGGLKRLELLASLFRDFAEKSGYYDWFNTVQRPLYEQLISQTAYNFRKFRIKPLLENYYGEKHHAYFMVMNVMGGYGNFGHAFTRKGQTDLYAVVSTNSAAGDVPTFNPSVLLFTLIAHEFSHGFVNPAVTPYIKSVAKDSALYEPIKGAMQAAGYQSWGATVYETIVPAAVTRLAALTYGKEMAYLDFYRPQMGRRFIYMDTLLNRLKYYEQHRKEYPTFRDFVPELLSVFDHITLQYIAHLQQKVAAFRLPDAEHIPKVYEFKHDSTALFIVGTYENDAKAQAQMTAWAKTYRNMISPESAVITDEQALKMDLSRNDIVLIGTPQGNLLLKRYIGQLPIIMLKDSLITNKVVKGDHLQLVTSWISPFNPHKTMVIYTAQQAGDIDKFQTSPYKDQYGYWVGLNTITLDHGEWVRYGLLWQCDPN